MDMVPEPLGGFREAMEEDAYRLVAELASDRRVEEAVEQAAMMMPGIHAVHHSEGPGNIPV
jgi:hypothetical protein